MLHLVSGVDLGCMALPQMEPAAFLAGLRQRTWTCAEFK
jgi:hypothetical protein